jgi:hypothetical protein
MAHITPPTDLGASWNCRGTMACDATLLYMAWITGCDFWEAGDRERRSLRAHLVIPEVLVCVEQLASTAMSDRATLLNYVITSGRTSKLHKPPCSRLTRK